MKTFSLTIFNDAGLSKICPWRVKMSPKLVGTKLRQCPVSAGQRGGETSVQTTPVFYTARRDKQYMMRFLIGHLKQLINYKNTRKGLGDFKIFCYKKI